jgi:hypothetical protein
VQVESCRAAEQEPQAFECARAALGEERLELDEPRIDKERFARRERDVDPLEGKRVLEHELGRLDRIAAPRHVLEDVAAADAPVPPPERCLELAQLRDPLDERHAARWHIALHLELEPDGDVVPGQVLFLGERPKQAHGLVEDADPEGCGPDREHEPERDRIEGFGAEGPCHQVGTAAEGQDPAAAVGQHR